MWLLNFLIIKIGREKLSPLPFCSYPIFLPKLHIQTSPSFGNLSGSFFSSSIFFFNSFQESKSFIERFYHFMFLFESPLRQKSKIPAPHSSRTLLRGGNPNPAEFQKYLSRFCESSPPEIGRASCR